MDLGWTHVLLLELIDNASSDTIDQVDGDCRRIIDLRSDHREHVGIEVLVEQLAVLTESCRENSLRSACLRFSVVLGSHINHAMLFAQSNFPDALSLHGIRVDAVAVDQTILLVDGCEEQRRGVELVKSDSTLKHANFAFTTLGHCK